MSWCVAPIRQPLYAKGSKVLRTKPQWPYRTISYLPLHRHALVNRRPRRQFERPLAGMTDWTGQARTQRRMHAKRNESEHRSSTSEGTLTATRIRDSLTRISKAVDVTAIKAKIQDVDKHLEASNIWRDNPSRATKLGKTRASLERLLDSIQRIETETNTSVELLIVAKEEGDEEVMLEALQQLNQLGEDCVDLEIELSMGDDKDVSGCFMELHSGAGGVESMDWTEMLKRMYVKWCADHHYTVETVHESRGSTAGIKATTLRVEGPLSYGWLRLETGVHRLVRVSPFDSNNRRHTSFASVRVYPIEDEAEADPITESDLEFETFRASGAGGQHVNTTDSAVRVTHKPTGVVAQCQNERSQHQNKRMAVQILSAKLAAIERDKKREEARFERDALGDNGWGNQIRSYVLHPYQMVKDHRTKYEESNPKSVLDGNLTGLLKAARSQQMTPTESLAS